MALTLNVKTMVIIFITFLLIFILLRNNNTETEESQVEPEQQTIEIDEGVDAFWTKVVNVESEKKKMYQYQLPNYFQVNPKFLMYHPNFSLSGTKMVQIMAEEEGEAVAMLNLWVALNKGLLDNEENFSELFETTIMRAVKHPKLLYKMKEEIESMIEMQVDNKHPDNLEFTEDLALSEVLRENVPINEEPQFEAYQADNMATL